MPPKEPLHRLKRASSVSALFEDGGAAPLETPPPAKNPVSPPEAKAPSKPKKKTKAPRKPEAKKPVIEKSEPVGQGPDTGDGSVYAHVQIYLTPVDLGRANEFCKREDVTLDYLSTWICQQVGEDIKKAIAARNFPEITKSDCATRKSPLDGTSFGMVSVGAPIDVLSGLRKSIGDPLGVILDRTLLREITRKIAPDTVERVLTELEYK